MSVTSGTTPVDRAREAVGRGDWREALDLLIEGDASGRLSGADLPLLADVAYAAGRPDLTIRTWERAYASAIAAEDRFTAAGAAARVAMHLLFDTGLMAPVRGWVRRAERLLDRQGETPIHAWLAVVRSYERLLSGDFEEACEWAERAIDIGTKHDRGAAALGRVAYARSLILAGDASLGLDLLNEAAVAAVSGELDPLWTGVVYCEVVCALQALAQYDLAEEWTAAMEVWRHGKPVGSIHGRCRVHRAEILRLRGCCEEAEREAIAACDELRPYLRRELGWPLTELGRIRLRTGDEEGAEAAFHAARELGWDPEPGLALLHLTRGDHALAEQAIRNALEHPLDVPSKELPPNTDLRRAPLLEAQVEIELAVGSLERARTAADELSSIAASFASRPLVASARLASARVRLAEGDAIGARRGFEEAEQLWTGIGAPYEAALSRIGLAHAHRAEGNEHLAKQEFRIARSAFERTGAKRDAAEAARASDETHCTTAGKDARALRGESSRHDPGRENIFRREGDYWVVTFEGRTTSLRDRKGLHYIARLLSDPGREFHALDLVTGGPSDTASTSIAERGTAEIANSDAGVLLDPQAKEAYRRRLGEIEEDLEEAHALGDHERAAQAETERDFLIRELARAVGLGGRDRRAGSASERARASVTRAVRQAMSRIREHHSELGAHLDQAIRTGTYCAYVPERRAPTVWRV